MENNLNFWFILWAAIALAIYLFSQKINKKNLQEAELQKNIEEVKNEINRRSLILGKVEEFIKGSKFIDPIATWKGKKIYKYIFNNGQLYEFDEIQPENKQKVGIDEEMLCFDRVCYKRVKDTEPFIKKFGDAIKEKIDSFKNDDDQNKGKSIDFVV